MTFAEYVALLRAGPLRGAGAALPRRRLPGAAPDRARRAPRPRSSTTSSSGSASWSARSTRACSTSGSSSRNPDAADAPRRPGRRRPAAARSPATRGRSGCWCATRCSAGSSWPRCAAGTSSASWTPTRAGTPTRWARGAGRRTSTSTTRSAPARTPAGPRCCIIEEQPARRWRVRQILDDPAGDHDWGISAEVDLAASDEAGAAVVRVTGFEPL